MARIDKIKQALKGLEPEDKIDLHNLRNREMGYSDDEIYPNDEDFFNMYYSNDPYNAVQRAVYGNYQPMHDYVMFDGYGNLKSLDTYELEKYMSDDEIAEFLDENEQYIEDYLEVEDEEKNEVSEEAYYDSLEVLPPFYFDTLNGKKVAGGFAVGEPTANRNTPDGNKATYSGFYKSGDKYFEVGEVYFMQTDEMGEPTGYSDDGRDAKTLDPDAFGNGGGVRRVNGKDYPIGSSWTKEHNYEDKRKSYEVPQADRKRKFAGGGGVPNLSSGYLKRRLKFIQDDVARVFKNAPEELLDTEVKGWETIGTLLSNIEIASDITDNESDGWRDAMGGKFDKYETGGSANSYNGKNAEEVWNNWNINQREHFLSDHNVTISSTMDKRIRLYRFDELPPDLVDTITYKLKEHIARGSYSGGGSTDSERYKVVKIFRKSGRREILEKNLTLDQARRVVERYPNSNTSMVVFTKMYAQGGGLKKPTYIPNEDIESLKTNYGQTISGRKLLDGAYATGKVKKPTMSRTQFEDESYEYGNGGFVSKGELVWKKITDSKKAEFLYENFTPQITPRTQETLVGKSWNFLPKDVKIVFQSKYANVEDYGNGGGTNSKNDLWKASIGGHQNKLFLMKIGKEYRQEILNDIANHYGISVAEAKHDVTHRDSAGLYQYASNLDFGKKIFNDMRKLDYENGGNVGTGGTMDSSTFKKGGYTPKEPIAFSSSNLYFNGYAMDINGNSVVRVSFPNSRAFSIQTNGTLPKTNNAYGTIGFDESEINSYVKSYGSPAQKKKLKIYKK